MRYGEAMNGAKKSRRFGGCGVIAILLLTLLPVFYLLGAGPLVRLHYADDFSAGAYEQLLSASVRPATTLANSKYGRWYNFYLQYWLD